METDNPMNRSQETIYDLVIRRGLLPAKAVSHELGHYADWVSDICRRERVDFVAVCNRILRLAEPLARANGTLYTAIAGPIIQMLLEGTHWHAIYQPPTGQPANYAQLCEQTGVLLKDLGAAIEAVAAIEADGAYDEQDDVRIHEFAHKATLLQERLQTMLGELHRRRAARTNTR